MTTTRTIRIDDDAAAALSRMLPELHEDAIDMIADTSDPQTSDHCDTCRAENAAKNEEYTKRLRAIMILADQLGIDLD